MKIKKGDLVCLIYGGDEVDRYQVDKKGVKTLKTGKIIKVYPKLNKVVIEGFNLIKKTERPQRENEKGKIIEIEAPIHISNVAIVDPKLGVPTKVGYKFVDGQKVRFAKKSGELLDKVSKKAVSKKATPKIEETAPVAKEKKVSKKKKEEVKE
jgi:large subunit ribosomal protein L24